jgi:hypothetical protein
VSWWLACVLAAALAPLGTMPGCSNPEPEERLNPRPEELPSGDDRNQSPSPSPTRSQDETCDDNPLLAGCELPDMDINGNPALENPAPANTAPAPQTPESAAPGASTANPEDEPADAGAAGDAAAP